MRRARLHLRRPPRFNTDNPRFCNAIYRYSVAEGTPGVDLDPGIHAAYATCILPANHDGNHLCDVPKLGYRAFPR